MENKNDKREMLKNALILTTITLIAGLLLGFVHELTAEPIRVQQEKAVSLACSAVFGNREDIRFELQDISISGELTDELSQKGVTIGNIYLAKDSDGNGIGYVVESVSGEGYGGNIVLYVGISMDGVVNDVSILEISETPGLGMRAGEVLLPQFHEREAGSFFYTKTASEEEFAVDAISGATITTKAVINAVNGACSAVSELKGGESDE